MGIISYLFGMIDDFQNSQSIRLPFIGSRSNGELFEYLLLKINERSALISLPSWLVDRTTLDAQEEINLHITQLFTNAYKSSLKITGKTFLLEGNKAGLENLYRIEFTSPIEVKSFESKYSSSDEIKKALVCLIKDSMLIKSGIYIYLKHLIPYLSRIVNMSTGRFQDLKEHMLSNIHQNVYDNMIGLENLYIQVDSQIKSASDFIDLNLDAFGEFSHSEIDLNLFALALHYSPNESAEDEYRHDPLANPCYSTQPQNMYVDAIKLAEQRLYENYNSVVSLYGILIKPSI